MVHVVDSYTTKSGKKVQVLSNGDKKYLGYKRNNKDGSDSDREITVIRHPDGSTTSENTAKTNENDKRRAEGKKPIPKQKPGHGIQIAHKPGTTRGDSGADDVEPQSAHKNIGDGNKDRVHHHKHHDNPHKKKREEYRNKHGHHHHHHAKKKKKDN